MATYPNYVSIRRDPTQPKDSWPQYEAGKFQTAEVRAKSPCIRHPVHKRGERMTCVECGAEIGAARGCRRCGAPVPGPPQDDAPVPWPAAQEAAKSPKVVLAWAGIVLLNLLAVYYVVLSVVIGTEGNPSWGQNYLPPWVCAVIAFTGAIVPACTVVVAVRRRRRSADSGTASTPEFPPAETTSAPVLES